jgi:hypothetical protein
MMRSLNGLILSLNRHFREAGGFQVGRLAKTGPPYQAAFVYDRNCFEGWI